MSVQVMKQGGVFTMAASDTVTGKVAIRKIRWVGATTAAHTFQLRSGAYGTDEIIAAMSAATTNYDEEIDFGSSPLVVTNLRLETMTSGACYIYRA